MDESRKSQHETQTRSYQEEEGELWLEVWWVMKKVMRETLVEGNLCIKLVAIWASASRGKSLK